MAGLLGFTLADLTGAVDSRKRQYGNMVRGLLSDPKALMEQLSAQDAEAAQRNRYTQASAGSVMPEVAQQGQQAMMDAALNVGGLLGITAFHGSPHKFDKFDMSKIGTGEGAQAYGHGLYFAESPAVAKNYAETLANKNVSPSSLININGQTLKDVLANVPPLVRAKVTSHITAAGGDMAKAVTTFDAEAARQLSSNSISDIGRGYIAEAQAWMKKLADTTPTFTPKPAGNLYKVDIPDDAVAKMLDWDKPLSQQPEAVRNALKESGLLKGYKENLSDFASPMETRGSVPRGQYLHNFIAWKLGGEDAAAAKLKELGIPGIKYKDAGSRGGKGGTSNFVLFDDNLPKIISRE